MFYVIKCVGVGVGVGVGAFLITTHPNPNPLFLNPYTFYLSLSHTP